MKTEMIDGIRVLKLRDHSRAGSGTADDMMTMVHLWKLLSGGHALRDMTATDRRFL